MSDETAVTVTGRENNVITRKEENSPNERLFSEFNKVVISGKIETEFEYSHKTFWEEFYRTKVRVTRYSGIDDFVPIVVSNLILGKHINEKNFGKFVEVTGEMRTYNKMGEDGHRHLDVFLFLTKIEFFEKEEKDKLKCDNLIYLKGYICKVPVYRKTPLAREITDLVIAVNRPYGKSDYIPCIAWGRIAQWSSNLKVGSQIELYGRIQSREYFKRSKQNPDEGEYKEVCEISIKRMQPVRIKI